jgi:magnesium chelatase subunit H
VATYNFGGPFSDDEWMVVESDLAKADVVFVIHVMDSENASRLIAFLDRGQVRKQAIVAINCMPELMKRTRLGKLNFAKLSGRNRKAAGLESEEKGRRLIGSVGSWIGRQARSGSGKKNGHGRAQYLKFTNKLPSLLKFVPGAGALGDAKRYLMMFCYFLQPTPNNIRSMLLYSLKHYADDQRLKDVDIPSPEVVPSVAIYHPDAPALFESFEEYHRWYVQRGKSSNQREGTLEPESTIGLLLMRPQIVSRARKHYDGLIRAIESEGFSVVPAISTLMDNREACRRFFLEPESVDKAKTQSMNRAEARSRISQIVSLTGFSFVGGPAMNDSEAASEFLKDLNLPFRSMISLDTQTIESWQDSFSGLNPVQTGMQIAIPEIDGATEPFVFGGITAQGVEPAPLTDRCQRIARRLKRWHRLQSGARDQLKLALTIYCFPPNKGNIGTAADLDVFASLFDILAQLKAEGYTVDLPAGSDALRETVLGGNSEALGTTANVVYRMRVDEYRRLSPYVSEIEADWGAAPGAINSSDGELFIQGVRLGNIFIGLQPTFGFEDDPMRMMMAKGGTPHHGFAAFYLYLEKVFMADAVVHVGTHGAMEFMPGKQVGLSESCWPDRLIGELPNVYIYSVNNPSEGTIARRRSYAELISYLTPPVENAGLYRGLASLKDLIRNYRQATSEDDRQNLYEAIQEQSRELNLGRSTAGLSSDHSQV